LIPDEYDLQSDPPCIRGQAYCGQTGQEHWRFTLVIAPGIRSRERIDWPSLLPAAHLTGWVTPCPADRMLTLNPLAAHSLHSGQ
jgi:hypothetical protein